MGKIAFVFPGQGSQKIGMGLQVAEASESAKAIFDEADNALGFPLSKLCFEGPEEQLRLTQNTQPAILTTSIALYRVFQEQWGQQPDFVAGHSLGEYSALVAAEAFSFRDAVKTVYKRGTFMTEAVPNDAGAMSAVLNLDREVIDQVCKQINKENHVVEPANYNCPGQVVISGHKAAVEEAGEAFMEAGAKKVVPLAVSGPFHSSLMKPAAERLAEVLAECPIHDAQVPVVANVIAESVQDKEQIRQLLIQQVYSSVRWEESIRYMVDAGVDVFVEIGPGKVLSGLIKKTVRKVKVFAVEDLDSLKNVISELKNLK